MTEPILPPGFMVGHWSDPSAVTGCTVIICPPKCVGGCDVRGSSPGSRELALLASDKTMQEVHAVLLTGGSAYGLAAADGVMAYLEEHNIGYVTPWARVPIVPAAVIFDLNIGSAAVRPVRQSGYQACSAATPDNLIQGSVGAGTGATVGKWGGGDTRMMGGLGIATQRDGPLLVTALAVVNAVGDVIDAAGGILAGARAGGRWLAEADPVRTLTRGKPVLQGNTTLVAILTNASLTKVEVNRMAQRGHDGMARAIVPVHTSYDGDAVFGLASGEVEAPFDLVAELGAAATAYAIRHGVVHATSTAGIPAHHQI